MDQPTREDVRPRVGAPLASDDPHSPGARALDSLSLRTPVGDHGSTHLRAPEWALTAPDRQQREQQYRLLAAAALVLLAVLFFLMVFSDLPGEEASSDRAARAGEPTASAGPLPSSPGPSGAPAPGAAASASPTAAAAGTARVAGAQTATTDADLLRVAGGLLLALVSVLSAAALLVPRASVSLSYAETRGAPAAPEPSAAGEHPAPGGADGGGEAPKSPAPGADAPAASTSVVAREPALVQGVAAAVLVGALVFGINVRTDADRLETVFSVLAPAIPLAGAFFVRRRVTAAPLPA